MKITRELWREVEPLLASALEMAPAAREAWLAGLDTTHPGQAPVLRRLLEAHEQAERSRELETVPRLADPPAWTSLHAAGERVGPFELVRLLGHGGMGEVWFARQVDGRVVRDVALKLPVVQGLGTAWRERFRREVDILARLEHPNIARLYDAGVTEARQPWLAMEHVEGHTLTAHLARAPLRPRDRLALFRQVLAAVAHAHRHLVVHRDLKPANILIDGAGQVKLLDFGIARIIDDEADGEASALTRQGGRAMTLRYAAPEQVSGAAITTATDIYALGVILHELLTGESPYRAVRDGRTLREAMLLEEAIGPPSRLPLKDAIVADTGMASGRQLAHAIAGDLDAIVLKALRQEPAERYVSVELLDADIAAHLERRPVKARAGTWRYLAGRYVVRHKLPIAAAAAVVASLVAGLVLVERERRVAVAEKARAEQHFASVRKLANTFIFDVHRELEPLAGSLKARRLLVSTSLEYLDRLAAEGAADPELIVEVAGAYRQISEIEGDTQASSLGDPAAARRHAEKARALLADLEARGVASFAALQERRRLEVFLAGLLKEAGDVDAALAASAQGVAISERIVAHPQATVEHRRRLAGARAEYAVNLAVLRGDLRAVPLIERATEELEAIVRADPTHLVARANLAGIYERASIIAEMVMRPEDQPRAIAYMEKSIAVNEALARDEPGNQAHEQALIKRLANLASSQADLDPAAALRSARRAVEIGKRVLAREPENLSSAVDHLRSLSMLSTLRDPVDGYAPAVASAREAIAMHAKLPADVRKGLRVRAILATAQGGLAQGLHDQAQDAARPRAIRLALAREARQNYVAARALRQELVDRDIDARSARAIVDQIDAALGRLDPLIAGLARA